MALLTLRLYDVNGLPAQAAGAVTLADSTNTWGIQRDRDNAVMLAAGAATSNPLTGVYQYDYTALGLDPHEEYDFSFKYGPTSFQTGSIPAVGGTTLRRARRALAERLAGARAGSYELIVAGVQVSPPSGVYVGAGSDLDANRAIFSTDLTRMDEAGTGAGASPDRYDGGYVYVLSPIPEQRGIVPGSYNSNLSSAEYTLSPLTPERIGRLMLQRKLGAIVPAGTEIELHTRLPVLNADGKIGLHQCINRALETMRVAKRLEVDAVTGDYRYEIDGDWVIQGGRILGALEPESTVGYEPYPVIGGQMIRADAEVTHLQLDTGYSTGDTFYLETERSAKSWVRTAGTWQDSSVGLVHEADEAAVPLHWLATVAYFHAADTLSRTDPRGENSYWAEERIRAMRAAVPYLMHEQQEAIRPVGAGRFRRPGLRSGAGYWYDGLPRGGSRGGGGWP